MKFKFGENELIVEWRKFKLHCNCVNLHVYLTAKNTYFHKALFTPNKKKKPSEWNIDYMMSPGSRYLHWPSREIRGVYVLRHVLWKKKIWKHVKLGETGILLYFMYWQITFRTKKFLNMFSLGNLSKCLTESKQIIVKYANRKTCKIKFFFFTNYCWLLFVIYILKRNEIDLKECRWK